jgi:two-component system copper resistance phosphate regulon response regulator CusR
MFPLRILVIEDDRELSRMLARGLGEEGHAVALAEDGVNGLAQLCTGGYDLCVLDVLLPLRDGFSVLADARAVGVSTPVLMLTARDAVEDRVRGLGLGADDYLVKPFAFAELLARIAALGRRGAPKRERERVGHIELDSAAHRVFADGRELELSAKQYALLEFLIRHRGEVVSRSMILRQVFGYSFEAVSNIVDVHISSLRQKIDRPGEPSLIVTVRGVGYRLEARA